MRRFVVDASVAIKWVVQEPGTEEALLLRQHALIAPDLITAECANILWKKARRGELSQAEASMAAQLLARADITLMPMRALLASAAELAIELDHPAYDCVYIALAIAEGLAFVTADERLVEKVRAGAQAEAAAAIRKLSEVAAL